jgi:transposase-like protein
VTSDEGPRGKIRPQKGRGAIAALLTQKNIEEAARSIGIGHATLLRWLKESEFDTAYREARRAAFRQSVARLQQASGAAVTTLLKLMIDPAAPPSTKARAADSVLDHSAKAIELEDIEARVSELERAAEASKQHR